MPYERRKELWEFGNKKRIGSFVKGAGLKQLGWRKLKTKRVGKYRWALTGQRIKGYKPSKKAQSNLHKFFKALRRMYR